MTVCDFVRPFSVSDDAVCLLSLNGMLGWAADAVQMWWRGEQYKYSYPSWDWSPVVFPLMSPPWLSCPWCQQRNTTQTTPETDFLSMYFDELSRRRMRTDARCSALPISYRLVELYSCDAGGEVCPLRSVSDQLYCVCGSFYSVNQQQNVLQL